MSDNSAKMTGDEFAESIAPDKQAPTPALGGFGAVGNGAELSAAHPATTDTHILEGWDAEKMDEKMQEETTNDLATEGEMHVPVSELPLRPRHMQNEDSGSELESEPDYYKTANPHTWKRVVTTEVNWSSRLNTTNLYEAYVARLRDQDKKSKREEGGDNDTGTTGKAPGMIRGMVDYVRVLEERIQRLETLGSVEDQEVADQTETRVKDEYGELITEAKFFHAEGEFDADGDWEDNIHKKGSYQCVLDPRYLIRVLFNWSDGMQRKHSDIPDSSKNPDPNEVDILSFGIESRPIAKYFEQTLGFTTDKSHLLRFSKPFRPLIHHSGLLQAQLEKLKSKFGPDSNPIPGGKSDPAPVQDDSLPPAFNTNAESENETAFDTIEALVHFRCLFKFMDDYLAKPISLYRRLRDGHEDKIAFENMWMLFNNGEKIYCPSHSGGTAVKLATDEDHISKPRYVPQLFQVLGTSGGLPKVETRASQQTEAEEPTFMGSSLSEYFFTLSRATGAQQNSSSGKQAMTSKWRSKNRLTSLDVVCFHIDFDGVKYGTVREIFHFKPYDGLLDIRSLAAFPVQYLKPGLGRDSSENEAKGVGITHLVERGKKFVDVTALAHLSYDGLTVGQSREEISSAVIIDFNLSFQEYKASFPDSQHVVPQLTRLNGLWPAKPYDSVEEFIVSTCDEIWCHKPACTTDTHHAPRISYVSKVEDRIKGFLDDYEPSIILRERGLLEFKQFLAGHGLLDLLPGVVPGFALRNRKWVQLNLDLLSEIEQGDDWQKLVLPPGHREMVQAMVVTHSRGSQQPQLKNQIHQKKAEMDLVQGKGKGCIILLHGVPGVGKTSTAECVAAYTQRPLYPITCGDIGYVPAEVERNMEEHFKLAHKWGCVLLLDEADVFLAKRNKADVKRNGLVSVFLRILEYYPGILFLTTNRVGAIDDAFRSRLHLTLYYPKLTKEQTRKIWKNNLDRLKVINRGREESDQEPIHFDKKELLEWVKLNWELLQWNGRQIRNAFQTAIALAEFHATSDDAVIPSTLSRKKSKKREPKGPLLDVSHFKLIADATLQFNEYLFATHGFDEDELAKRDKIRLPSHETTLKLKEVTQSRSSSSDESESEVESAESSSDESVKEAARRKAKRKDKKKKSKAKKKSKKAQSSDGSSESESETNDKKPKTKKQAKKMQSQGSSDESDKGATSQKA